MSIAGLGTHHRPDDTGRIRQRVAGAAATGLARRTWRRIRRRPSRRPRSARSTCRSDPGTGTAVHRGVHGAVDVGIVEHDERRLAAQLEQRRLEVTSRLLGDDAAYARGPGEVHPAHGGVGNDRLGDTVRVLRAAGQEVEHPGGQARLVQDLGDDRMSPRAGLRRTEDDGVTAHDGIGDGPGRQDSRAIPRRHAEHDPGRLADRHEQRPGLVSRDRLALDLRNKTSGLAEKLRGEEGIEAGPQLRRTHFGHHRLTVPERLALARASGAMTLNFRRWTSMTVSRN